ncbi:ATP-binding protein [Streptomyces flavofungini]|uniref:ATP-binding protein n=1 Tax=Streptomyces flavofungini TaxID=68200 RepID=A0ABS0XB16_9ACTN|nr:ATP-binding protein [Streptomyces flavofungini]MBJ3810196.1 ATP-binding protein [Streptomyces flavofungini]GHC82097.1 ATP-binding protein [Streptomyces flavofungini]
MNHTAPQLTSSTRTFRQQLASSRRSARLARLLAVTELHTWVLPPDLTERAELVVAELAANAVLHGRVPGRNFELALTYTPLPHPGRLLIEVSDARGDRLPRTAGEDPDLSTGGRGLTLVALLADHWETVPRPPGGKTVRAELATRSGI